MKIDGQRWKDGWTYPEGSEGGGDSKAGYCSSDVTHFSDPHRIWVSEHFMTKNSILTAKLCEVRSPVDKSSDNNSSPVWAWDPPVRCSVVLCCEHCVATDRNIRLSEMLIGTHSTCHRTRPTIAGNLHQNVENKSQARYLHCAHKPGFNSNILG